MKASLTNGGTMLCVEPEAAEEARALRAWAEGYVPDEDGNCTSILRIEDDVRDDSLYFLQDTRGYVGNCPLWWGPGYRGYVTDLEHAGRYTFEEAMRQHRSRPTDLPWPCSEIRPLGRKTVDLQDLPRDNKAQAAALRALAEGQRT